MIRSSAVAHAQRIGVVFDIHRRGAQVNDAAADRALLGIGLDLGHQVVLDLGLDLQGALHVDLIGMGFEIGHLLRRHQSKPRLALRPAPPRCAATTGAC